MNLPPPSPLRRRAFVALLLTGPAMAAGAQQVWRCGPQRNVYSQQPCDDGRAVEVDDRRDETQQREARRVAGAQADEATRLRRERLAREAEARPAVAASLGGRPRSALDTPGAPRAAAVADKGPPPKAPKPKKPRKARQDAPRPLRASSA